MIEDIQKATDEFYERFEKLIGKTFFIKLQTREYDGVKLVSVDRQGSPVRFLTFKNKPGFTPTIISLIPTEFRRWEVLEWI